MQTETVEWIRLFVVYTHVILSAFAISLVLRTDWALVVGELQRDKLAEISRNIIIILLGLWVSGLGIIYLDTGFDWSNIASNSKLLLKLICVIVLTLNGIVLHTKALPLLIDKDTQTIGHSLLLAISGSVSTAHWMLAAFLGLAYPLKLYPLQLLVSIYAVAVLALCLIAALLARWLSSRLDDSTLQPTTDRDSYVQARRDTIERSLDASESKKSSTTGTKSRSDSLIKLS